MLKITWGRRESPGLQAGEYVKTIQLAVFFGNVDWTEVGRRAEQAFGMERMAEEAGIPVDK